MRRVGSAARKPNGKLVPSAIGTSPTSSPTSGPDHALDPVDERDRLQVTLEHRDSARSSPAWIA